MLRSLTLSLSAFAAITSITLPVKAVPQLSVLANNNQPKNEGLLLILSQVPETIPEIIVDTIPIEEPSEEANSPQAEEVVVETEPSDPSPTPAANNDPRFTCEYRNGRYTVMYNPQSQPDQTYPWAIPQQMGGNWSPERRCLAISQRLESYRPDGLLELQTSVKNNQNIVCVTSQADPSCRIVFTVPSGQDPISTRDRVFENLAIANQGQQTQGVNTFTNGSSLQDLLSGNSSRPSSSANNHIDLRPFLDQADGGTGNQLRSTPSPFRLDPRLFQ